MYTGKFDDCYSANFKFDLEKSFIVKFYNFVLQINIKTYKTKLKI